MKAANYDAKFADLIRLCKEKAGEVVIIHDPQALGDDYEELVESLNRIADAGIR